MKCKAKGNNHSHNELVEIAYKWCLKNASCGVAFKELVSSTSEQPDVIGFGAWGHSVLIECKCSRSDFKADFKKPFRTSPEKGMGLYRLYCCPSGLIKKDELPDKWGLVYVNEKGKAFCVVRPFTHRAENYEKWRFEKRNLQAETSIMYSALRRLHIRRRIDEIYEPPKPPQS